MKSSGMNDIELVYQDERFTTLMAEKVLIEAGCQVVKKERKSLTSRLLF